jgi:hypothetical protein
MRTVTSEALRQQLDEYLDGDAKAIFTAADSHEFACRLAEGH